MRSRALLQTIAIALGLLLLTLLSLAQVQRISHAQGGVTLTKVLNRPSPVVRVGELLSFVITLTNNAGFTLTNVTLVDTYNQNVLAFASGAPGPDGIDTANGILTWTNVAVPPIPPNQTLTFTVFFTAEHPQTTVVNAVRAQDITGTAGAISDSNATDEIDEAVGGQAPLFKSVFPPGSVPQVGQPVTFSQIITNDGAAIMTLLPLTDTYNPAVLQFNYAIPTPTLISPPGLLVWADLTSDFGDLDPFETVVVTTVFTALAQFNGSVNQASTAGAQDQYNNNLDAGFADVPITIIAGEGPREEEEDDDDDDDDDGDDNAPVPTATALVVNTPAPTATPATGQTLTSSTQVTDTTTPKFLPETGYRGFNAGLVLAGIALLGLGGYLLKKLTIDP